MYLSYFIPGNGISRVCLAYQYDFVFLAEHKTFRSGVSVFSRALSCVVRRGGRVHTTGQMRALAEVRGASCGPSKSLNPAGNCGEAFRTARAEQVHGNPKLSFHHVFTQRCCSAFPEIHTQPTATLKRLGSQALAFATATNVAFACERVSVCVYRVYAVLGSSAQFCCFQGTSAHGSPQRLGRRGTTTALQVIP